MRKILVCGSRIFTSFDYMDCILGGENNGDDLVIISGGAKGADELAAKWAEAYDFESQVFPADWDKHGKSAGYIRNQQMIDQEPDIVIAFWDGKSKGTRHTIGLAHRAKINVLICYDWA